MKHFTFLLVRRPSTSTNPTPFSTTMSSRSSTNTVKNYLAEHPLLQDKKLSFQRCELHSSASSDTVQSSDNRNNHPHLLCYLRHSGTQESIYSVINSCKVGYFRCCSSDTSFRFTLPCTVTNCHQVYTRFGCRDIIGQQSQ